MDEPINIAADGCWGQVVWAKAANGRMPARDFFMDLSLEWRAKVHSNMQRLADYGTIPNPERFENLGGGLYQFKNFQYRFIGQFQRRRFIVGHGLKKKSNKLRQEEIERAVRILREHREGEASR